MSKKINIKIIRMDQPEVKPAGKQKYKLLKDWRTEIIINNMRVKITCMTGAEWDGASMPRFSWSLLGIYPGGRMLAPSLVHDGFCDMHVGQHPEWFLVNNPFPGVKITPYIRDLIFKESCRHIGILSRRAKIMWFCVMLYQRFVCLRQGIKYNA